MGLVEGIIFGSGISNRNLFAYGIVVVVLTMLLIRGGNDVFRYIYSFVDDALPPFPTIEVGLDADAMYYLSMAVFIAFFAFIAFFMM